MIGLIICNTGFEEFYESLKWKERTYILCFIYYFDKFSVFRIYEESNQSFIVLWGEIDNVRNTIVYEGLDRDYDICVEGVGINEAFVKEDYKVEKDYKYFIFYDLNKYREKNILKFRDDNRENKVYFDFDDMNLVYDISL